MGLWHFKFAQPTDVEVHARLSHQGGVTLGGIVEVPVVHLAPLVAVMKLTLVHRINIVPR